MAIKNAANLGEGQSLLHKATLRLDLTEKKLSEAQKHRDKAYEEWSRLRKDLENMHRAVLENTRR